MARHVLMFLAAACLFAPPLAAQVLVPPVGEPGDVIAIEGSGLGATQHVEFLAIVGGFVGFEHLLVTPLSVNDTRVEVQVPVSGHFLPPPPLADGDPVGLVTLLDGAFQPIGAQAAFGWLEITFGAVKTLGTGSPLPAPQPGAPAVAFDLAGGAPAAGNPAFALELHAAAPGAACFVLAGRPAPPPWPVVNGGTLVTNLQATFLLLGPYPADGQGVAVAPLPVPATAAGLAVSLQWAFRHPQDNVLRVSNALVAQL